MSQGTWSFPKEFWSANFMELCERAAYYGFFIVLTLYLTSIVGFTDAETGIVVAIFMGGIYLLPPFVGAIADKVGFRRSMILAFGLLTAGYTFLGIFHSKAAVLFILFFMMIGASFIKPLITGTVAKVTTESNRARGFSLFYWMVNIGAFGGKTFVPYIRQGMGLAYVNFFSAAMSLVALICAIMFFKSDTVGVSEKKSVKDALRSMKAVFLSPKLLALTLIVAGFWMIQQQMYATMPKYVIRLVGEGSKPEWLANVNPFVVVCLVMPVTQMMKKFSPTTSILIGLALMPFSALAMANSQTLQTGFLGLHPLTVMMILGIAIQAIAECFISPRYLEYFSMHAPKGEEGLYLGFSHFHSFFSSIFAFGISGFLLEKYCPDPKTLQGLTEAEKHLRYAHAYKLWYIFIAVGLTSVVAFMVFLYVTRKSRAAGRVEEKALDMTEENC